MKRFYPFNIALAFLCLTTMSGMAQFTNQSWVIRGKSSQTHFEFSATNIVGTGGVIVSNETAVLTADTVSVDQQTGDVAAEGDVTIVGMGDVWRGSNVFYNFTTREVRATSFKSGQNPFFISANNLSGNQSNNVYSATDATVTTDDYADPIYRIRAKQIIIVPGHFVEAYDATIMAGNVPVFHLPHFKRFITRRPNNFAFRPGYRGSFGPFLLSRYNFSLSDYADAALRFDWRQRRGFAGGPEILYDLGKAGRGELDYYYAHDDDPTADQVFEGLREDRQRISFVHEAVPTSNLLAKVVARWQNDPQVIRDFFESEYRKNVQPNSFAEVTRVWPNWVLDVEAQPQLIDFYETVERLPDVKLTGLRQQLWATPIFYESESSFGYFRRQFSSTNTVDQNYAAGRGDSFHQLLLPKTFFGWLNVTPRVGGRVTYYTDVHGDLATATNDQVRGIFNTGAEVSTKASKLWRNAQNRVLDVQGLRHIVEPSVNYVFVPEPNRRPFELPQFDYETPSLRLLPIDFPDYNSIDSIDTRNALRLSLRNKLQTKRESGLDYLLNWAFYTDLRLERGTNLFSGERQSQFSDLYSDLDFKPREWLTLNSQLRYDTENTRFREAYHRALFQPNSTWNYSISHRYLMNNDPEFGEDVPGYNTFTSSLYYKLNENWAARIAHRFEARDGKLEEQWYTLYRDLRSWTSALTLRFRENRAGRKSDVTIAVTFSLKAFPRYKLNSDIDKPELLIGY